MHKKTNWGHGDGSGEFLYEKACIMNSPPYVVEKHVDEMDDVLRATLSHSTKFVIYYCKLLEKYMRKNYHFL
jgi:hypothetical protein